MSKRSSSRKKKGVNKSWPKVLAGLIGIALTISGWAISNVEHINIVKRVIAPKYDMAMKTWTKMTNEGFVLKSGQAGFSEMRELFNHSRQTLTPEEGEQLSEEWIQIKNLPEWDITQFKTIDSRLSVVDKKRYAVKAITLEIQSSNFHTVTIPSLFSVDEAIDFFYLKTPIFKSGAYIFWTGILISIGSIFIKRT